MRWSRNHSGGDIYFLMGGLTAAFTLLNFMGEMTITSPWLLLLCAAQAVVSGLMFHAASAIVENLRRIAEAVER